MDQEQQPIVWPPAPKGMEPTPSPNLSAFKPAPTQWVIGLTFLYIFVTAGKLACKLILVFQPFSFVVTSLEASLNTAHVYCHGAAYIAFLAWFYQVYKNLAAFGSVDIPYTAGWAIGWFFVPIYSLFRPYQMAQTIWKVSSPELTVNDPIAWQRVPGGTIIKVWWGMYLFSYIFAAPTALGSFQIIHPHTVIALIRHTAVISNVWHILIALIAMQLVRAISARQLAKEVSRFWSAG